MNSITIISERVIKKMGLFFVKFIFYYFKALGLVPLSLKVTQGYCSEKYNFKFTYSKMDNIYNIFFIFVIIILKFLGVSYMKRIQYKEIWRAESKLFFLNDVIVSSSTLTILVIFCLKQNEANILMNRIQQYVKLSTVSCEEKISNYVTIFNFCIIVGNIILLLDLVFLLNQEVLLIIFNVSYNLTLVVNTSLFVQYSFNLDKLKNSFGIINNNFKNFLNQFAFIRESQMNQGIRFATIMKSYYSLIQITNEISNFYSALMLLSTLNICISSFECLFSSIKMMIILKTEVDKFAFMNFYRSILSFVSVLALTINVTHIEAKSEKIKKTVVATVRNFENLDMLKAHQRRLKNLSFKKVKLGVYNFFHLNEAFFISVRLFNVWSYYFSFMDSRME